MKGRSLALILLLTTSFFLFSLPEIPRVKADTSEVLDFLEKVVLLDVKKFSANLEGTMVQDYSSYSQLTGKYTLTGNGNKLSVLFKFRNNVLSWVFVRVEEGVILYSEPPITDALEMVKDILRRYQEFSGDTEAAKLRDAINYIDELENIPENVDNLKFTVSSDPVSTSLRWNYYYHGLEYSIGANFQFENGNFVSFSDNRMFHSVGDPTVNISNEEAIAIALEHAEALLLNASNHEWTRFKIMDEAIHAELNVGTREINTYYPYWSVNLPRYNSYLGNVGSISVTIWADNGLVSISTSDLVTATSYSGVLSSDEYSWNTSAPMRTARSGLGVAVVDDKIYAIGGYNGSYLAVNEMYDPETDMWTTKTSMPTPRTDFAVVAYQNKIYVFGGIVAQSNSENSGYTGLTEVYDPSTDTWETEASMPTPRSNLCANVVDDRIYLLGGAEYINGIDFFQVQSNINEVYDPITDTWTTKTPIPQGTLNYVSAVLENKIYVIGGAQIILYWHGSYSALTGNWVYNAENDTWTSGKTIPIYVFGACGATTGVLLPKGFFVIGYHYNVDGKLTQMYDPKNDTWLIGTQMPTARRGFGVAVVNDELYVIGGKNTDNYLAINEKYIPANYIPEFPSWVILPLSLTATLVATFLRKRLKSLRGGAYL